MDLKAVNFVTTSFLLLKALVTTSKALVTTSFLLLLCSGKQHDITP